MRKTTIFTTISLAMMAATGMTGAALAERGDFGGGMAQMHGFDFASVDADKDGKITKAEMDAFRAARVAGVDADADGLLSQDELVAMTLKDMTARATDIAAKMIKQRDADGDGKLSAAEMAAASGPEMLFDAIDENGDGAITQEEADAARQEMQDRRGHDGGGHGWMRGWGFGGGDDNN